VGGLLFDWRRVAAAGFGLMVAAVCLAPMAWAGTASTGSGIRKIRHVVIIMQENRSFDSYFGTYPGADGIPGLAGHRGKVPCVPDPARHDCQKPYHNRADSNAGDLTWRSTRWPISTGGR
jgi:phospholipase C